MSATSERVDSDRLAVRDGRETELVVIADIDWIDAAGDYMCLHVGGKTHIMRSTMKELLEKLPSRDFVRIHRSTIVNIQRVTSLSSLSKGEFRLQLGTETSLESKPELPKKHCFVAGLVRFIDPIARLIETRHIVSACEVQSRYYNTKFKKR